MKAGQSGTSCVPRWKTLLSLHTTSSLSLSLSQGIIGASPHVYVQRIVVIWRNANGGSV